MHEPIYDYRLTSYDTSILPTPLLAVLEQGVRGPRQWIERSGRSIGHPGWGLLYHLALCHLSPTGYNLVIETGTNLGSTTLVLAQALEDSGRPGVVRTIELDETIHDEARQRAEIAGLDHRIEFWLGNSLECLGDACRDGRVRMALLDGNHFHDHVVAEFALVHPHLEEEAVVVLDNTGDIAEGREDPRVHGGLKTIVDRWGGNLINLPYCSWYTPGIAMWQQQPFRDMEPPRAGSFDTGT